MTVSETEEHEPLLTDAHPLSYSACNDKDGEGGGFGLFLEKLVSTPPSSGPNSGSGSPYPASPHQVTYTWHDIAVTTTGTEGRRAKLWRRCRNLLGSRAQAPRRKTILHGVNGEARPGELTALMGASGAGKTSLLNVLTFRTGPALEVKGVRAVNGEPVSAQALTRLSAYVQQNDLFIGTLTVREHLVFQALVRMDRHIPMATRMQRVQEVIAELALTKCENTVIGITGRLKGISGGEMKRLSFASEVLTDPPIMFCDEPTSGLDSFMAQNVVSVLKGMALKGKTVICTIHQPSSEVFAMFDKLLLLAEGRVAYLGEPHDATAFFSRLGASCPTNYNPADFFIQLLAVVPNREDSCRETIGLVCDAFERSPEGVKLAVSTDVSPHYKISSSWGSWDQSEVECSPYKASWWTQFSAVLWRSWLSVIKEPMLIKVRLLQTILVAVIISIIYYNQQLTQDGVMNINGALFIFLTNMTFQNVFSVINVFCSELPVFMREHLNGMYRVDVYFLCKTLAEVPIFLAIPVIFSSITYYSIGLHPGLAHFAITTLIIVLVANVATSFGYLISCVSTGATMALSIGPPVIIPFLLFGGFFLNSASVPPYFKWLSYLSWFKYGNEALLINQWADVENIDCTRSNVTCPRNGQVILETLNFDQDDFALDVGSLVVLILSFRFLAYLALLSRTYRYR